MKPRSDNENSSPSLTRSMEDYLETILQLVEKKKVARVKDIARIRGVKPGSVSPAMRRLSDMGLVVYVQREFIDLTAAGRHLAGRIWARHNLLLQFFRDILQMDPFAAEEEACAIEHSLSDEGMDRLSRLVDFLASDTVGDWNPLHTKVIRQQMTVLDMSPGQFATVARISAMGETSHQLLDMGLLPDSKIRLTRISEDGSRFFVKLQGFEIQLTREQAKMVIVSDEKGAKDV